jgi:inositol oxygenase
MFTKTEIAPLASLDEWEEDVLKRYPEQEPVSKTKEAYRNYEEPARDTVREFYRLNHTYQTYEFVQSKG